MIPCKPCNECLVYPMCRHRDIIYCNSMYRWYGEEYERSAIGVVNAEIESYFPNLIGIQKEKN